MTEVFLFRDQLTLGQKVRITRIAKRWTQTDLAYEAGVPQGCISALERDRKVYPSAKKRILDLLGLSSELQPEAQHGN
jgi:transcriptional regulator with XRE-family HTH domain